MQIICTVIIFLCMITGSETAFAEELAERREIRQAAISAYLSEDFAKLDEMAELYRSSRARTSSGLWKISEFYDSFATDYRLSGLYTDDELERKAFVWQSTRPTSVTAKLAYASYLKRRSWSIRGQYAYNLMDEDQKTRYMRSVIVRDTFLRLIEKDCANEPHWYKLMAEVAQERGWSDDRFDALLADAVRVEPYYYSTYFVAISRSLTRWGGSPAKVATTIAFATEQTQEHDGASMIARGYWIVAEYGKDERKASGGDWKKVSAAFRDLLIRYPDQWNINAYAKFACLAQDRDAFLSVYSKIRPRFIAELWGDDGLAVKCAVWGTQPHRQVQVE